MIVNGMELEELDIFDIEVAERYEKAIQKVKINSKIENIEDKSVSEVMKAQCEAIGECFNDLYGSGTDKKIFNGKLNLLTSIRAFNDLVENVSKKKDEVEKEINGIKKKYSHNRVKRKSSN